MRYVAVSLAGKLSWDNIGGMFLFMSQSTHVTDRHLLLAYKYKFKYKVLHFCPLLLRLLCL